VIYSYCNNNKREKSGMGWPTGKISDDSTLKKVFLGETRWKKKSRKTKIMVVRLY